MATNLVPKKAEKFRCLCCDFNTSRFSQYERHLDTEKHKRLQNTTNTTKKFQKVPNLEVEKIEKKYECENCHKKYLHHSSLWKHKQNCNEYIILETEKKEPSTTAGLDADFLKFVLENNTENIKNIVMEVCKQIQPNMNNSHNNIQTHNNSHNKTFNLQIFLNETCKDAMNLTDFINSIDLQLSDLESVGKLGFVNGISNILIKNLNAMDVTKRPVHCSDTKREVMYVKEDGKWEKDEEDNAKLRKAIKRLAFNNSKLLPVYRKKYPDSENPLSTKSDMYNKLVIEAYGGKHDDIINENKIIKNIVKQTGIDKDQFAL
jgi:hypothetical protein